MWDKLRYEHTDHLVEMFWLFTSPALLWAADIFELVDVFCESISCRLMWIAACVSHFLRICFESSGKINPGYAFFQRLAHFLLASSVIVG